MTTKKIITQREFDKYIDPQLHSKGWAPHMREAVRGAFLPDLEDAAYGERQTLFHNAVPGIDQDELKKRMSELRDPNSPLSKALRYPLHNDPKKLDELEGVMNQALEGDKGSGWF